MQKGQGRNQIFRVIIGLVLMGLYGSASALQPANAADFVDLPDGMRVTGVRRIPQPAVLPGDLQRTSA